MATSGLTQFNLTVDEIIIEAFKKIGNQPIGAEEALTARTALNLLFIDMTNRGSALSNVSEKFKPLTNGVNSFILDNEDIDILDMSINENNTGSNNSYLPMTRYSLGEFQRIVDSSNPGRPMAYTVSRERDQVKVTMWNVPNRDFYTVRYLVKTKIEDVTASTENIDLPARYLMAVIYGLAWLLCDYRTDVPETRQMKLEQQYETFLKRAMDEDGEKVTLRITPFGYNNNY